MALNLDDLQLLTPKVEFTMPELTENIERYNKALGILFAENSIGPTIIKAQTGVAITKLLAINGLFQQLRLDNKDCQGEKNDWIEINYRRFCSGLGYFKTKNINSEQKQVLELMEEEVKSKKATVIASVVNDQINSNDAVYQITAQTPLTNLAAAAMANDGVEKSGDVNCCIKLFKCLFSK